MEPCSKLPGGKRELNILTLGKVCRLDPAFWEMTGEIRLYFFKNPEHVGEASKPLGAEAGTGAILRIFAIGCH